MTLEQKIKAAQSLVARCIANYHRPVIMSSFGKDSLVMMSIIESVAPKLPIVFHREPFCPEKYAFADSVIKAHGLTVYDYPPMGTAVLKANGHVEIMNAYQVASDKIIELPTGIVEPTEGAPFLCGYRDLYNKPTGTFAFPWDLGFVGHKSSDVDPIKGPVPLLLDVVTCDNGPSYAFPIRFFTDEDIWKYTEANRLPIHLSRYNAHDGYGEYPDKSLNPDYFPACVRCMDPDAPLSVYCPRLRAEIMSRKDSIRYIDPQRRHSYMGVA